ncbi:MFS transporter [Exiguobacterium sp. RIT594]|uniref:MFS transporter n=1 Tax=Exiguobacterium sp. RIT594 TaxID=2282449 RepID=UPI000DF794D2|nr:MFS transporter [Exiguobacterium sp. RIT594]RDB34407.1 MFS transporter [Exiguobacterium sp. RIT594]
MKQIDKRSLWTKEFVMLSSINFFLIFMYLLLNSIITLYALNELGTTTGQAGLVAGIFIIGALVGRLVTGMLLSKLNGQSLLRFGLLFFALTMALYILDFGFTFFAFTRLLNGFAMGIATTIIGTIVVLTIPEERSGEGIGYFAVSTALATGIGPFVGLFLMPRIGFTTIFLFCLLLAVLSLVCGWFLSVPSKKTNTPSSDLKWMHVFERKALPISLIILVMTFCFSSILSYISLFAIERNLITAASYFFIVYTLTVLVSRPVTGRLMDQRGPDVVMYPAFLLFAVGLFLLSNATDAVVFLFASLLIGLGFGNLSSISQTMAVKAVPREGKARATATFLIFFDIGNGLGPVLLGLMLPVIGYTVMYVLLGIIVLLTILFYRRLSLR